MSTRHSRSSRGGGRERNNNARDRERLCCKMERSGRRVKGGRRGGEGEDSRHSSGGEPRRGTEATAWRAGPCENGDVLNLC